MNKTSNDKKLNLWKLVSNAREQFIDVTKQLTKAQDDFKYYVECLCGEMKRQLQTSTIVFDEVEVTLINQPHSPYATIDKVFVDDNHSVRFLDADYELYYSIDDIEVNDVHSIIASLMMSAHTTYKTE